MAPRSASEYHVPDDVEAAIAGLQATVRGLNDADQKHETQLAELTKTVASGFSELRAIMDKRAAFPTMAVLVLISVLVAIGGVVGSLARQPLVNGIAENAADIRHDRQLRRADVLMLRDHQERLQSEVDFLRGSLSLPGAK